MPLARVRANWIVAQAPAGQVGLNVHVRETTCPARSPGTSSGHGDAPREQELALEPCGTERW